MATVHIYTLSRLVHARAGDWERQMRLIERGRLRAYGYYLPLREAVVAFCKSKGKQYDEILESLELQAGQVPTGGRGANPVKDNKKAFDAFVNCFYPRIVKFGKSLLRTDAEGGCDFEGLQLLGTPHFTVLEEGGHERYVFLHASKWKDYDLKAYLELLSAIIAARFGATPKDIWCMDLRSGKDHKWKPSSQVRTRCEKAAALYGRLFKDL